MDLESELSAALDATPSRRTARQTIGDKLGVNSRAIGAGRHRTVSREFADARGQIAAEIVTRLPKPRESIHWVMDGTFIAGDTIPIICALIDGPVDLTICTLGINDETTDLLAAMLRDRRLTGLRLAFSSYFKASDPDAAGHAVDTLTKAGATVACERLHAKLQLYRPAKGRDRYVVETSANLRSCQCVEIAGITNSTELHEFHDKWLAGFFERNAIKPQ